MAGLATGNRKLFSSLFYLVVLVVCLVYVSCNPALTGLSRPTKTHSIPLQDGWTTPDGTPVALAEIDALPQFAEKGATLEHVVPNGVKQGEGLCFLSSNATLHVFVDDQEIYSFDPVREAYEMPYATQLCCAPLSPADAGKLVRIEVAPVYEHETVSFSNVRLCERGDYIQSYVRSHIVYFAESIIVCFMGLLVILLHIALRGINHGELDLLSLGVTFVLVGIWSAAVTLVVQFTTGLAPYVSAFEYFSLLFVPLPIVYFTSTFTHPRRRAWFINTAGLAAVLAIGSTMVLALVGHYDLHRLLPISHAQLVLCVLLVVAQAISSIRANKGARLQEAFKTHNFLALAFVIFMACGVVDFARFLVPTFMPGDTALFMRHGIFLFSVSVAITAAQASLSYISRAQYADKIELIAYTDALTQLGNRAAWKIMNDEMDRGLADGTVADVAVCQFDVNFLKRVNDTQGHAAGDLRIKHSAETIKRSYGIEGTCYRTGGDEFTAILSGDSLKERLAECEELFITSLVEQDAANKSGVPLSLAVGTAFASETEAGTVQAAQKLADARMYENKRAMKATRD